MTSTTPPGLGLNPGSDPVASQENLALHSRTVAPQNGNTTNDTVGVYVETTKRANYRTTGNRRQLVDYTTTVTEIPRVSTRVDTSRSSVRTAGFYQLVRTGAILPVNPFQKKSSTRKFNSQVYERTSYTNGILDSHSVGSGPKLNNGVPEANGIFTQPTSSRINSLDNEAKVKLRLALKNQAVNIAMIVAERNKTAASFTKIVRTIAEMVIRLKKGDLPGAAGAVGAHIGYRKRRNATRGNPSEAFANAWLELQYAIKPFLMDVNGLVTELARIQYPKVTGTATATTTLNVDHTDVQMNGLQTRTERGSVKLRYVVYFQVDQPVMSDATRLGLTNPVQLAWELIPFSFVVDWFLTIGDWLSSVDATVGLTFSDGSKSIKRDLTQEFRYVSLQKSSGTSTWGPVSTITSLAVTSSFKLDSVDRTKLTSFPGLGTPVFKNPMSLVHLISALALLRKLR